jgi:hypothetical protein
MVDDACVVLCEPQCLMMASIFLPCDARCADADRAAREHTDVSWERQAVHGQHDDPRGDAQPHLRQLRRRDSARGGVVGGAAPAHRERTTQGRARPCLRARPQVPRPPRLIHKRGRREHPVAGHRIPSRAWFTREEEPEKRSRGRGERSSGDLRPPAADPIEEDGGRRRTHLARRGEDGRALMNENEHSSSVIFLWAGSFSILKVYPLLWNGFAVDVFNQTPTKIGSVLSNSGIKHHLNVSSLIFKISEELSQNTWMLSLPG